MHLRVPPHPGSTALILCWCMIIHFKESSGAEHVPASLPSHRERILTFAACWEKPPLWPHLEAARALASILIPLLLWHRHGGMQVSYAGVSLRNAGRMSCRQGVLGTASWHAGHRCPQMMDAASQTHGTLCAGLGQAQRPKWCTWSCRGCRSRPLRSRYSMQSLNSHHARGLALMGSPSSNTCSTPQLKLRPHRSLAGSRDAKAVQVSADSNPQQTGSRLRPHAAPSRLSQRCLTSSWARSKPWSRRRPLIITSTSMSFSDLWNGSTCSRHGISLH